MTQFDYFGKSKTGGSNASYGFSYQDHCAMLFLLKHYDDPAFEGLGIETDDDFCLLFGQRKVACQVKYETLTVPLAKVHMGNEKILIGSSVNKELDTLWRYVKHFRNQQSSPETSDCKFAVSTQFADVLKKHAFDQSGIAAIPDTWSIEIIQEHGLEQRVAVELIACGVAHHLYIDSDNCLFEFCHMVSAARKDRGYITGRAVLDLLKKHGRIFIPATGHSSQMEFLHRLNIDQHQLLESVDVKLSKAQQALKTKQYQEALDIYHALADVIESEQLLIKCAALFQVLGNLDQALGYCDKALQQFPRCSDALAIKGTLHAELGDLDFALELLTSANAHKPGDPFILYNIGVANLQLKSIDQAAEWFGKAIEADPNLGDAHLNLSVCLFHLGRYKQALEHVERALIFNPGQPQALSQKGELKRFYGDYEAALRLFERCLQHTPDNPIAKQGQALCLIEKGDLLGYALLVRFYDKVLSERKPGERIRVADIGWERTLKIDISNIDEAFYKVECGGLEVQVPKLDNSHIGIGVDQFDGESRVPIIMKSYANPQAFMFAVTAVSAHISDTQPVGVKGIIRGHKDHCEIRVELAQYTIYGKTDPCEQTGFHAFCDAYDGVAWLILECAQSAIRLRVPLTGLTVVRG